jgi:hypothetical protein
VRRAGAREAYEAAGVLYRKIGYVQGKANCIEKLNRLRGNG